MVSATYNLLKFLPSEKFDTLTKNLSMVPLESREIAVDTVPDESWMV